MGIFKPESLLLYAELLVVITQMRKQNPLPFHLIDDKIVLNYVNSSPLPLFQITGSILTGPKMVKQTQLVPTARPIESNSVCMVNSVGKSGVEVSAVVLLLSNYINRLLSMLVLEGVCSLWEYKPAKENTNV